jgi:hypothetical protein
MGRKWPGSSGMRPVMSFNGGGEIALMTRWCGSPVLTERGLRGGGRPHGAHRGLQRLPRRWRLPNDSG